MIQATVDRLQGLASPQQIFIITGAQYVELAQAQLPELPAAQILAEPCGRNTAPALGLACLYLRRRDPQAVLVALPSDHVIREPDIFRNAIRRAVELAQEEYIVTLGIEPTAPHTGYGYIQRQDDIPALLAAVNDKAQNAQDTPTTAAPQADGPQADDLQAYAVRRFLEKPDAPTAQEFLRSGGYYWNAGMFICRAQRMLDEIERQLPELHAGLAKIDAALEESPQTAHTVIGQIWPTMPNISIDHGIMEKAQQVAVIPLAAGWSDVGSWDALETILPADSTGNVVAGGQLVSLDSAANIVYAEGEKLVALIGVEDLVVVDTGDAILVGQKQQMQRVKEIVDRLKSQNGLQ